jgi:hypothetical protein
MFEALRCIFVPYRPRAIEDRLLGLPAEEPALDDFGSKLTLATMSTHFAEVRPSPPPSPRKSDARAERGSYPGLSREAQIGLFCQSECFKVFLEVLSRTPHPDVSLIHCSVLEPIVGRF